MSSTPVTRAWVAARLDSIYPSHIGAFVRLLTDLRTQFDGDLDAMLVLAATSASAQADGGWDALLEGETLNAHHRPTNTQSIAHQTGIPRETVRRKLRWLQDKGWVTRDVQGNWTPSGTAARDLEPATEATITYLRTVLTAAARA
jgi:DNA-binding transcriptional ArsR family regulator